MNQLLLFMEHLKRHVIEISSELPFPITKLIIYEIYKLTKF